MIQKKLRNYSKLLRDTLLDFCSQYHLPLLCTAILAMFMFHVASTASNIQRALSHTESLRSLHPWIGMSQWKLGEDYVRVWSWTETYQESGCMGRCRKSNFRICYIDVWCTYLDDLDRLDGIATALAVISLNQLLLVLVCITQAAQARERVRGQVCTSAVSSAQPCTAKDPIEWLERFFAACEGCQDRDSTREVVHAHRDSTPREKDWRSRRRSQFCGHGTCRHTHTHYPV